MAGERRPRVLIIGGGFGGLTCARALRRAPVDVTLVDRRNHHLFQPLLYQVATAALSATDIAYPIRAILRRQSNARVFLADVTAIDAAAREVVLRDGRLGYDWLVLATGARDTYFGHDEWQRYAPGLKSLEDALEIRRRILLAFEHAERADDAAHRTALLTFVVIGGGPTGVELAGAIGEISRQVLVSDFRAIDPREARVLLIEAGPRVLPTFHPTLSADAAAALESRGVEVRTGTKVTDVAADAVTLGTERVTAGTILWAAGVRATALAASLGVALDRTGRVPVAPDLTVPGRPEIFVIGDAAAFTDAHGTTLPGVAPVAIQQGRHVAANIRRACAGQALEPFAYWDKGSLASIGRAYAVAEIGRVRLAGFVAWLMWIFVHIAYLVGFRNRVIVLLEWGWAYLTFQRSARLITGTVDQPRPQPASAAPSTPPARSASAGGG
jgi:NADH dehydrogenase